MMVDEFYAVTMIGDILHVRVADPTSPSFEKIAGPTERHLLMGEKICDGTMLGIGTSLQFYTPPTGERLPPESCFKTFGKTSPPIAALFLRLPEAVDCSAKDNLVSGDPRYITSTEDVIAELEEDKDSNFYVTDFPLLSLLPA